MSKEGEPLSGGDNPGLLLGPGESQGDPTVTGREYAQSRKVAEPIRRFSIPADPTAERFLPDRFGNVMFELYEVCGIWEGLPEWFVLREPLGARLWAREHTERAAEIMRDVVTSLDDLCIALRSQHLGQYFTLKSIDRQIRARGGPRLRRGQKRTGATNPARKDAT